MLMACVWSSGHAPTMLQTPGNTPKQLKVAAVLAAVGVPRLSRKVRHGLSGTLAALVDERAGYSGVLHTRASVWEPSSPRHYAAEYAQHTTLDACTAASYRRQQSATPSCKCGLRQACGLLVGLPCDPTACGELVRTAGSLMELSACAHHATEGGEHAQTVEGSARS